MRHVLCVTVATSFFLSIPVALADVDPSDRTADLPDSWLVLFNLNSPDSVLWADWYQPERSIPAENMLGLDASTEEHLPDRATAEEQILTPVESFLDTHPDIDECVMGIVLGYDLPSHFGCPPIVPDVGGFSVANALQDLTNETIWEMNLDCPHMVPPYGMLPAGGRLTKATIIPRHYIVAQIDGASLGEVQVLTLRAKAIEDPEHFFSLDASVWYDYADSTLPDGEWYWLKVAVENADLADLPWQSFDADTEQTPNDAIRFGTHDVSGWYDTRLFGTPIGNRVLAFNMNSWGGTTVRSCTMDDGRYVPNALGAGYAASIGATGEPQCCVCPFPDTLLASLREGWTLGEAFYLANPYDDWMWTLLGDPFLTIPHWFGEIPALYGDLDHDGSISLRDHAGFQACLTASGPEGEADPVCEPFDSDEDGDYDLVDAAAFQRSFTGGPVVPRTGDYDNDGQVTFDDFAAYMTCMTAPGPSSLTEECEVFDFDFDLDIDFRDFSQVQDLLE